MSPISRGTSSASALRDSWLNERAVVRREDRVRQFVGQQRPEQYQRTARPSQPVGRCRIAAQNAGPTWRPGSRCTATG
jgi:hypothetical protein